MIVVVPVKSAVCRTPDTSRSSPVPPQQRQAVTAATPKKRYPEGRQNPKKPKDPKKGCGSCGAASKALPADQC